MRALVILIAALLPWAGADAAQGVACGQLQQRYQGPLFDAMAQIEAGMDGVVQSSMREANVERMALFGRAHAKRSGAGSVAALARQQPAAFVVGAPKLFDLHNDLTEGYIRDILAGVKSRSYVFVGEILYTHGDKSHGEQTASGERYVDPAMPGTRKLLDGLKGAGAPLMAHWEVYDWDRDWPQFHAIYAAYPDVIFIWPHAGFGSAEQLETVLGAHPNVVATLSKKERPQHALSDEEKAEQLGEPIVNRCDMLRPEWRAVILKYHDRLMFATDAHKNFRWRKYAEIVDQWRYILGQLPTEVAQELAVDNATRLYGAAVKSTN